MLVTWIRIILYFTCFQSFLTKSNAGWSPWTAVDALVGLRLTGLVRPDLGVRRGRGRPPHIHRYKNFRNRTLEGKAVESAQDHERDRRANSDAHADGGRDNPEVRLIVIIDRVRLPKPEGEGTEKRVPHFAILTAAELAAEHKAEVLQCTPRAGVQNVIRITRRAALRQRFRFSHGFSSSFS